MAKTRTRRPLEAKLLSAAQSRAARAANAQNGQTLPDAYRTEIALAARLSLDGLRSRDARPEHWVWVTDAIRMGRTIDAQVYGGEYAEAFAQAEAAHVAAFLRGQARGGPPAYTGPELVAVTRAVEVHEEQLANATWGELRAALDQITREMTK